MIGAQSFNRVMKWLSFNRLGILGEHYAAVREQVDPRGANDQEEFAFFTQEFDRYYRKAERLAFYRGVLYVFLYATIFVSILKLIPILNFLVTFIEIGSSVVGGGLAVVLIFLITVKINMHVQRMEGCLHHLVALYTMNKKRDSKKALQRIAKVI